MAPPVCASSGAAVAPPAGVEPVAAGESAGATLAGVALTRALSGALRAGAGAMASRTGSIARAVGALTGATAPARGVAARTCAAT